MRQILLLLFLIGALAAIEMSSLGHPIERMILRASGAILERRDLRIPKEVAVRDARALLIAQEVQELRALLNFQERSDQPMIGATVRGYTTDPIRSHYLIDRGARDGVAPGTAVVAGDGLLVGVVRTVHQSTSMVLPLHDSRSRILAQISRESHDIHGIAEGRFRVGVELTYIPVTEELRVGDIVVTSGLQEGIVRGLVIGTIQEVRKNPQDLFQSAVVDIPYTASPPLVVSVIREPSK